MAGSSDMVSDVWGKIENKMKLIIPQYIKNILTACGYDNFYTIATIEESDLVYFKQEVTEGKVTKFFGGKLSEEDVFTGCTYSAKDFEFSRGHQKLVLALVKYVKDTMDKIGVDGFSSPKKNVKPTKKTKKEISVASKKPKIANDTIDPKNVVTEEQLLSDLTKHESELFRKAKATLEGLVPLLYKELGPDIKTEAVIEQNGDGTFKVVGSINCPICSKTIKAFNIANDDDIPTDSWNSSNYDRHVNLKHVPEEMKLKEQKISEPETDDKHPDEPKDNKIAETVVVTSDQNVTNSSEVIVDVNLASSSVIAQSSSEIPKEPENKGSVSKPIKEGDFIQFSMVDLESFQKVQHVAKVTRVTVNNVEAFYLKKSTKANSYIIPSSEEGIILAKCGVDRILRCVSSSREGEIVFSDIKDINQDRPEPKHKKQMKQKIPVLKKQTKTDDWKKEREKNWK